jgi:hypothetical protein
MRGSEPEMMAKSRTHTQKRMWGRIFFPGLRDRAILSSGIQDPGIPHSDFGKSELYFFFI